jgi:predicted SAM-dependent methyltransferase
MTPKTAQSAQRGDALNSPRVAVVLPASGNGPALTRAIDSVRRQTVGEWELLVAVDEADERQCATLFQLSALEARLRPFPRDSVTRALAAALRAVTAPLVTYLDCDHEFHPQVLEHALAWQALADVLVCGWDLRPSTGDAACVPALSLDPYCCFDRLMTRQSEGAPGVLHGRGLLDRLVGPSEGAGPQYWPWERLAEWGARFLPVPIQAGVWHVPPDVAVNVPPPGPLPPLPPSVYVRSPLVVDEPAPWGRALLQRLRLRGLHCGSGPRLQPGWVNTDRDALPGPGRWSTPADKLVRLGAGYYYLRHDALCRFPFGDGCFDRVYSEHFIEHIGRRDGVAWLREVRRMLAPGGVARISTPDLRRYVEGYLDPDRQFFAEHARRLRATFQRPIPTRRAWMVNQIFFGYWHRWIYDFEELRDSAVEAGFDERGVRQARFRQSAVPEMAAMDQERRSDESLYVELTV